MVLLALCNQVYIRDLMHTSYSEVPKIVLSGGNEPAREAFERKCKSILLQTVADISALFSLPWTSRLTCICHPTATAARQKRKVASHCPSFRATIHPPTGTVVTLHENLSYSDKP